MERERIEMLIKHHELIRDRYGGSDFACTQQEAIDVLKLALTHLDSTRARRVGEAVIEAVGDHEEMADWDIDRLLSTINAALRGEP